MTDTTDSRIEEQQRQARRQRYYRNRRTVQKIDQGPPPVATARMDNVALLVEAHRAALEIWLLLRDGTSVTGIREARIIEECLSELLERGTQLTLFDEVDGGG